MKILIVKLSAIGDVIHSLPVADYLKRALPDAEISWIVERASADMVVNNAAVDQALIFPAKQWLKDAVNPGKWSDTIQDAGSFFRDLRSRRFDAVLELQGLMKASLLGLSTGAPVRVGFAGTREFAETLLTDRLDVGNYFGHDVPVVELNLKLAQHLLHVVGIEQPTGDVRFPLPPAPAQSIVKIARLLDATVSGHPDAQSPMPPGTVSQAAVSSAGSIPGPVPGSAPGSASGSAPESVPGSAADSIPGSVPGPVPGARPASGQSSDGRTELVNPLNIVLIPGTTWISKIWPVEKWIELGAVLSDKYDGRLILIGARSEEAANRKIADRLRQLRPNRAVLDLTSQTSLLDLIALFEKSDLVIGGDTGPLHLAAAVGRPRVVGIFGATPWRRNGPYGSHCQTLSLSLDCQPCYSKSCRIKTVACLNELPPSLVLSAAENLLSAGPVRG